MRWRSAASFRAGLHLDGIPDLFAAYGRCAARYRWRLPGATRNIVLRDRTSMIAGSTATNRRTSTPRISRPRPHLRLAAAPGLRTTGAGCVVAGGGDVLGGLCSETFASARFISSWLALSSSMAFELSLAICCWFALSCSMFRSRFARLRAIVCSNCVLIGKRCGRCRRGVLAVRPEPGLLLAVVVRLRWC